MPTLRPQKVSGLVVIPTVEHDGNIYRVSLAIDVGMSRTGPGAPAPEVVGREDLVVELRNPSEGSLEAIASPDPGPLPVRALRVVQARGEFTYGQGVNPPEELTVNLRGDQKSFPMSQTFAPAGGGFSQEPQVGDRFPARPPKPRWPLLKPRCCVQRFETPGNGDEPPAAPHALSVSSPPAGKHHFFEMEGDFASRGFLCRCGCCEYRQFVRGSFSDAEGNAVRFDLPSGPLSAGDYHEDGAIEEFGPTTHGYYGHRATSTPGDTYDGTGSAKGCTYRANETPACPSTDGAHLEFLGLIVDVCRGRIAAKRKWSVDL
jgi:hypothetical protein